MDATTRKWQGRWDQLKGKAKQLWGQLTDDDLTVAEGEYDQLVGRIKERTGRTEEEVRQCLES
jgi:uncharacterized protein YjbJ (UPF0337 family)